jgi:hypothetical protein
MTGSGNAGEAPAASGIARLDDAARREIAEAQATMRTLIALIPRDFAYGDETDFIFHPEHGLSGADPSRHGA